jgi:hypothetical protein
LSLVLCFNTLDIALRAKHSRDQAGDCLISPTICTRLMLDMPVVSSAAAAGVHNLTTLIRPIRIFDISRHQDKLSDTHIRVNPLYTF